LALSAADKSASEGGEVANAANGANHVESAPTLDSAFDNGVEGLATGALHVGGSARVFEHEATLVANDAGVNPEGMGLEGFGTAG
jgi:hypothetical protein